MQAHILYSWNEWLREFFFCEYNFINFDDFYLQYVSENNYRTQGRNYIRSLSDF